MSGTCRRAIVGVIHADRDPGDACCRHFAELGATVLRIQPRANVAGYAMEPRDDGRLYRFDLGNQESWRAFSADLARRLETIELLVVPMTTRNRAVAPVLGSPYDWLNADTYRDTVRDTGDPAIFAILELLPLVAGSGGDVVVVAPQAARAAPIDDPFAAVIGHAVAGMVQGLAPALETLGVRINALTGDTGRNLPPDVVAAMVERIARQQETGRTWVAADLARGG